MTKLHKNIEITISIYILSIFEIFFKYITFVEYLDLK